MSRSPLEFLRHIHDELDYLAEEARVLDLHRLQADARARRAVVRSLEVIGEATKHLPEDLRARHSEVPWRVLTAMRDKMIHHYFGVDYEIVWDVLTTKVPDLQTQIRKVIEHEGSRQRG